MKKFTILFSTIVLMVMIVSFVKKTNQNIPNFDLQGHRGCRGLMPENTIASMLHAIDLGVNTLEMDVVITQDNGVILSHEAFFNHEISTKPNGQYVDSSEEQSLNVYKMSYATVKTFDVGLKPHPRFLQQQKVAAIKPLLFDVIDAVNNHCKSKNITNNIKYNIEIKSTPQTDRLYHPLVPEYCERVMTVLKNKQLLSKTTIQSFDTRVLQYLHNKYPNLSLAYLYEGDKQISLSSRMQNLGFTPTIYSPHYSHIDASLVQYCHSNNIKVIPWTVNNLSTMQSLKNIGVDGLISDYPNLYAALQ
jgi:glycerophosphoryl diester phosphodiesterase